MRKAINYTEKLPFQKHFCFGLSQMWNRRKVFDASMREGEELLEEPKTFLTPVGCVAFELKLSPGHSALTTVSVV